MKRNFSKKIDKEHCFYSSDNESFDDESDNEPTLLTIRSPPGRPVSVSESKTTRHFQNNNNNNKNNTTCFKKSKQQKQHRRKNNVEGFMPPLSLRRDVKVGYSVDAPMTMVPNAAFRAPSVSYRGSLKHFNDSENRFIMNDDGSFSKTKGEDRTKSDSQIGAINKTEDALDITLPPVISDRLMYAPQRSRLYGTGDAIRGDLAIAPACHGGWFDVSVNPETDLRSGAMGILVGHNNEAGKALAELKSKYTLGFRNHYLGPSYDEDPKVVSRDILPLYKDLLQSQ